MIGKLKDLTMNRDGSQNLTVTINEDYREEFDRLKDGNVKIELKKASKRRSLEANSYLWHLCSEVAKASSKYATEGKNGIYKEAVRANGKFEEVYVREDAAPTFINNWSEHGIGWFVDIQDKIRNKKGEVFYDLHVYSGTSTYDSSEMAHVIDYVVLIAEDFGIPTITPAEEERMLQRWGSKHNKKDSEEEQAAS